MILWDVDIGKTMGMSKLFEVGSIWSSSINCDNEVALFYVTDRNINDYNVIVTATLFAVSNDKILDCYADTKGGPAKIGSFFCFSESSIVAWNATRII